MGVFLAELGKKLAERWLSMLVVPGVLFLAVLAAARTLGHLHPFDFGLLTRQIDAWATAPSAARPSGLAIVLVAGLLAAAGAGVTAQALGSLVERIWLAEQWASWPAPARGIAKLRVHRRRRMWEAASKNHQEALDARAAWLANGREPAEEPVVDLDQTRRAMQRIALEAPARPTWTGDRIHAVVVRMDRDYQLDLPTVWPHLWLAMPETTRPEITTARESLSRAATLAGWGVLYLVAGALWWPGLLIPAAVIGTAWRRSRAAVEVYALLVEAAARLHTTELARSVGIEHTGPLDQRTGFALTCLLQGQSHLVPLTTSWPTPPPDMPTREALG